MPRGGRGSRGATMTAKRGGRRAGQTTGGGERITRSSKAKLTNGLEDPAQVEKELNAQLRSMGLYAANITGDGNCLFRALSDQLYGYPHQHAALRQKVCDYLESRPDRFAGFVDVEKSFDEYVKGMRQSGTYGGHLELSAFARLIQKEIKIVQPGLVYVISGDDESPQAIQERERREEERRIGQTRSFPGSEGPPPSERTLRKMRRANLASVSKAEATEQLLGGSPLASGSTESVDEVDRQTALAGPSSVSQQPDAQPDALIEAYGPLWIAYHNWEHYSSIRNVDGPHSGLPRINEKRVTAIAHGKETGRDSVATDSKADADGGDVAPTEEESLVLRSTNGYTLEQVRFYIERHGGWEEALEAILANEAADSADGEEKITTGIGARGHVLQDSREERSSSHLTGDRELSTSSVLDHLGDWRATSPSSVDSNGTRSSVERNSASTHATTDDSPEATGYGTAHGLGITNELRRSKRTASKDPVSSLRSPKRRSRSRSPMQSQQGSGAGSGTDLAGLVAANAIANISVASGEHTPVEPYSTCSASPLRPFSEESDAESGSPALRTRRRSNAMAAASKAATGSVEDPDRTPRARLAVTPRPVTRTLTMRERREMRKAEKVRRALDTRNKRESKLAGTTDESIAPAVTTSSRSGYANDRFSDVKGFLELKV